MKLSQLLTEALESLVTNKVRSALTMLGIIIGVAAVIAMMSIGAGAEASITQQIESIGVNLLYVTSGGDADRPEPLTFQDAQALADPGQAPAVLHVAPVRQGQAQVSVPGEAVNTSLVGITPEFFKVQTADVAEGQMITRAHLDSYASVVLLGSEVAEELFDTTQGLVGKTVRIEGQIFKVLGVLAEQGGTAMGNADNRVLIPLTTVQLRLLRSSEPDQVDLIYVQTTGSEQVDAAIDDVSQILRARHHTLGEDDFNILSTQSFLDIASQITGVLTIFLGGIAGVSLLVGGIGIMNIMLVTVTERTREIGLRKALGARKNDIRLQFLVESSLMSLGGGMLGIGLGWLIGRLVETFAAASGTEFSPVMELSSVLLATMFSAAIGLFFGIYPASRAASLEPVEALRTD